MKAVSLHSVVPVRTEASETSEQITQMLFGEICTIEEQKTRWIRVKLALDGQMGWVDAKMIATLSTDEYKSYSAALKAAAYVAFPMAYAVSENNGQTIPLTAGTRLTNYHNGHFEVLGVGFRIDAGMVLTKPLEMTQPNLLQSVRFFLNVPYLWGGKNALGMDCSGFTQTILSLFGHKIPRNASEQVTQGRLISRLSSSKAGDLAFFCHYEEAATQEITSNLKQQSTETNAIARQKITHVGILIDSERIIHCSGRVKIEKIDTTGIFSVEQSDTAHPDGQYTHRLLSIRRLQSNKLLYIKNDCFTNFG